MADQEQSTEQPSRPLSNVFRESFLAVLERPEHEAAFRVVGEVLHDLAHEGRRLLAAEAEQGTGAWRSVRGATGDVLQALAQLGDLGRLVEDGGLSREERRMLLAVGDAAVELQPIVARLNAAHAAFLDAEDKP
jgi:hypothetical protein